MRLGGQPGKGEEAGGQRGTVLTRAPVKETIGRRETPDRHLPYDNTYRHGSGSLGLPGLREPSSRDLAGNGPRGAGG